MDGKAPDDWKRPGRIDSCQLRKQHSLVSAVFVVCKDKMKVVRKTFQCDSAAMTVEYVNGVVLEVHGASARRREKVDGLQWMVEAVYDLWGLFLFVIITYVILLNII